MLPAHTLIQIDSAQPFQVPARKWFIYNDLTSRGLGFPRPAAFSFSHADFAATPRLAWRGD
jgi:hypothetical protein